MVTGRSSVAGATLTHTDLKGTKRLHVCTAVPDRIFRPARSRQQLLRVLLVVPEVCARMCELLPRVGS